MESRLKELLTAACRRLERLWSPVISPDTAEAPENARWRVVAVFLTWHDVEAWRPEQRRAGPAAK